jgi:hypothetical protein
MAIYLTLSYLDNRYQREPTEDGGQFQKYINKNNLI